MIALREKAKIGAIGLSAVDLRGLGRALPVCVVCVQNAYSLVSRLFEDMLSLRRAQGIAWVPFFPLGGAFPGWPKVTGQPKVVDIAAKLGITPSRGGASLLAHAPTLLLIPETADRGHLEETIAAASIRLSKDILDELDGLDLPAATEPRW